MEKLITIATYDNYVLANLMVAKLQDAGIDSVIADENIISVHPFYNNTVGGFRLQVMDKDADDALLILNDKT